MAINRRDKTKTDRASKVHKDWYKLDLSAIVHRRDTFRAEKSLIDQVMVAENIECVMESRVTALIGEKKLTELEVTNLSGENENCTQKVFLKEKRHQISMIRKN